MMPIELVANISDLMLLFNQLSTVFKNAYAFPKFRDRSHCAHARCQSDKNLILL